jgi:alkylhydroperoxidase family enzyme
MPTERLPNPATLLPAAVEALGAVADAVRATGLDPRLVALTRLRAGQINGGTPGVLAAADQLRRHGFSHEQVDSVAAWRDAPCFTAPERAALGLAEAVTRLADHPDPVPDDLWDRAAKHFDQRELAALLLAVALGNALDRLDVPTRRQAAQSS